MAQRIQGQLVMRAARGGRKDDFEEQGHRWIARRREC
jgi:hypothetical protein